MAINIEWQVKPPTKGNEEEEKPKMFPRIIDSEVVCEQRLAELMAAHGSLSRGNAKAPLNNDCITREEFEHQFGLKRTIAIYKSEGIDRDVFDTNYKEWRNRKYVRNRVL